MSGAELRALEKRWLRERVCAWCATRLTASQCGRMYHVPGVARCDMDKRRADALADYRQRKAKREAARMVQP